MNKSKPKLNIQSIIKQIDDMAEYPINESELWFQMGLFYVRDVIVGGVTKKLFWDSWKAWTEKYE